MSEVNAKGPATVSRAFLRSGTSCPTLEKPLLIFEFTLPLSMILLVVPLTVILSFGWYYRQSTAVKWIFYWPLVFLLVYLAAADRIPTRKGTLAIAGFEHHDGTSMMAGINDVLPYCTPIYQGEYEVDRVAFWGPLVGFLLLFILPKGEFRTMQRNLFLAFIPTLYIPFIFYFAFMATSDLRRPRYDPDNLPPIGTKVEQD
jgi:hypothetical protein